MSLAIVHSRAQVGVEAPAVTVEVHFAGYAVGISWSEMTNKIHFY